MIKNIIKYKYIFITILLLILLMGYILVYASDNENEALIPNVIEKIKEPTTITIRVDIKGEVKNPGVYELKDGSVVIDAINQSGGLTENADTSNINLAYVLKNAISFKIYSKKEIVDINKKEIPCICPSPTNTTCVIENIDNTTTTSLLVSINNGTTEELDSLNGIGPSTALKIVEYRTQNGKFETIDDIKKVSGIGDALFAKIKDFITI